MLKSQLNGKSSGKYLENGEDKTSPSTLDLYASHKGQNFSAQDRKKYYSKAEHAGRYERDIQNLQTQLKKYYTEDSVVHMSDNLLQINADTNEAAHLIAGILNRLSFHVEKGQVARQMNASVLIDSTEFDLIMIEINIKLKSIEIPIALIHPDITHYGNVLTSENREDYHKKNPDRYRRDIILLQTKFFNEKLDDSDDDENASYTPRDASLAHNIAKALNNCSYFVNAGKVATCNSGKIYLSFDHYKTLKDKILPIEIINQKTMAKVTQAEKIKWHAANPQRKASDIRAMLRILENFSSMKNKQDELSYTYAASNSAAKNAHSVLQRWSYLIGKDSFASKKNNTITMAASDFTALVNHPLFNAKELTARVWAVNPQNPAAAPPSEQRPPETSTKKRDYYQIYY
ncbi:MAG: hypothetical protein WC748_03915 [Legionellales bacterium]|jgi:hypothetical protein